MSAPGFTPGPWYVNAVDSKRGRIVGDESTSETFDKLTINGGNRTVATVYQRKDARLMASAPDLLAALRDAAEALERLPDTDGAFRATCLAQARAALAKAEGLET